MPLKKILSISLAVTIITSTFIVTRANASTQYLVNDTIDYAAVPNVSDYNSKADGATSNFEIKDGVFEWSNSNFEARNKSAALAIPLKNNVDTSKGKFTVAVTAKLPNVQGRTFRGFCVLGADTKAEISSESDNVIGIENIAGQSKYMLNADNKILWMNTKGNIDTNDSNSKYFMSLEDAAADYYTYKWVIDPQTKTFRFYYQKENTSEWIEPYANYYMKKSNSSNDYFDEKGVLPTGTLPDKIKSLKFKQYHHNSETKDFAAKSTTYIKKITVMQDFDLYVSSSGNDLSNGSFNFPFKSLEKAIETYKENSLLGTIYILDDIIVDKTISLDSKCSNIKISSYNNAKVTISGGYTGGDITLATENDLNGKLPKSLIGKIIKWDISKYNGLYDDETPLDHSYYNPELTDGDKIQTIARWPDNDWAYTGEVTSDKCSKDVNNMPNGEYVGFEFVTDAPIHNMTLDNAKINGFWSWDYRLTKGRVIGNGSADNTIEVKIEPIISSEYYFNSNRRYYLYNIPEEITSPGEYYIDYENKYLYYYPADINNLHLSLTGIKESMFKLEDNCNNAEFDGISFENIRGTAITGKNINGLKINNCRMQNIGGRGVYIFNTYNTCITRSYFNNIGDSSIEITGGDVISLIPSNSTINNCEFANGARISGTYAPFIQLGAVAGGELSKGEYGKAIGINVENNYFYNHMHSAVMFDGNDFVIKNNIFDNVVNQTQDAGAIYSRVNPTYRGNEITNNIFRNIRTFKQDEKYADVFGVYMDDLISDVNVSDNLFDNCSAAANFGGGQSHIFANNLVYNCYEGAHYLVRNNRGTSAASKGYLSVYIKMLEQAVLNAGLSMDIWYNKYPNFKKYCDDVKKYSTALSKGDVSADDLTNENYDILHITGEKYSDNVFISKNANCGISNTSMFCNISKTSSVETQNVNAEHNYLSDNLDMVSINNSDVLINSQITAKGYKVPDVLDAGIAESGMYTYNTGKIRAEHIKNPSDTELCGYILENFEEYSNGESVQNTKNIEMTGDAQITADGKLHINKNNTVAAVLPFSIKEKMAFEISYIGKAKIDFGTQSSVLDTGIYVFQIDYTSGYITVYKKYNGNVIKQNTLLTGINDINKILITALDDLNVNYIGFSDYSCNLLSENILDLDFENGLDGNAFENEYDKTLVYCSLGVSSTTIKKESDGNTALKISENKYDKSGRLTRGEIFFSPVKTDNNVINVEFKVKQTASGGAWLQQCVTPMGYNGDNAQTPVNVYTIEQNSITQELKTSSGITIANAYELKANYVNIKYEINKLQNCIIVYKMMLNGIWTQVAQINNASIPEYINRLFIETNVPKETYAEYLFDDIKVYTQMPFKFADENDNECELDAGKQVYLKPNYIPGITGGVIGAALYTDDGIMQSVNFCEYLPDCRIKINIPSDNKKNYRIKRFIFNSLDSIEPIVKEKLVATN